MKIRIGTHDFDLIEMSKHDAVENYGLYYSAAQEIHLNTGMNPRRRGEVLIHEILHGIADMMNMNLKDEEERIVRSFALGLAQVMRDNQKLFTEILKAVK